MVRAFVFDNDGVVLDSEPIHTLAYLEAFLGHGIPVTIEQITRHKGKSAKDVTNALAREAGIELEAAGLELLLRDRSAAYRMIAAERLKPFPDAELLLRNLISMGYPIALATSGSRDTADFVLELTGLKQYFRAIITASDVTKGKPNPEIYLKAARSLDVSPGDCLGIEDSIFGIQAVKSAGMKCIGVATTFPRQELALADVIVGCLSEITPRIIRRLEYG